MAKGEGRRERGREGERERGSEHLVTEGEERRRERIEFKRPREGGAEARSWGIVTFVLLNCKLVSKLNIYSRMSEPDLMSFSAHHNTSLNRETCCKSGYDAG